ncbi:AfsR/SARP family transcriptional regulator [Amycolatopsis acidicola]|nr:AfsR/SARP family transcriptional regulator [Amycolatopsis acidicola]
MLGAFQVEIDDKSCFTPDPPKERTVLALLALLVNRIASVDTIISEIWGNEPPKTSVATARTYIYHLRKIFVKRLGAPGAELLVTRIPGYLLRLPAEAIDANVFCDLVTKGRQLLDAGRPEDAAVTLREALGMWQGPALGNVPLGLTLSAYATFLEEERRRARELRITADMRLGRHRELISEIRSLVAGDPLNEWLSAQLMIALSRCGRRGEALGVYADLRNGMETQLGLDPSQALQRLHYQVLVADQQTLVFQ